ncbi:hypothetical protein BDZ97DRAFT_1755681 [Flammula alnicola]|nr:hypothetical protein BDZ97DRAFT_1755681 [Flammula alnicola]
MIRFPNSTIIGFVLGVLAFETRVWRTSPIPAANVLFEWTSSVMDSLCVLTGELLVDITRMLDVCDNGICRNRMESLIGMRALGGLFAFWGLLLLASRFQIVSHAQGRLSLSRVRKLSLSGTRRISRPVPMPPKQAKPIDNEALQLVPPPYML